MLFNSLQFLVFFLVVTLWFFLLRSQKARIWLLLIASCYFYMSFVPVYILILGFTILIDYFAGLQIECSKGKARRSWLVLSLIANVGILAYFKYCNFFIDNLNTVLQLAHTNTQLHFLQVMLPIGLSFHTFQAMSYTIEVYRGHQPAERHFVAYALYVMFYPQLVAGPIERPQNVLPQLHEFRPYNWDNVKEGLSRMLWGFFKKVVIADRLAIAVDNCFAHHQEMSSGTLLLGAALYSFQIYCDFSGYSDIGIGAARVMNIGLMENFNQPYLARNFADFWSRWHISLSTWFRDYVYIPLGGNRRGEAKRKRNVFTVFLLSGLWHGANWTFVAWGALHGTMVTFFSRHRSIQQDRSTLLVFARIIATFLLVTIFWIFFRAQSIGQAIQYIHDICAFRSGSNAIGLNNIEIIISVILIVVMMLREYFFPTHTITKDARFWAYAALMAIVCYTLGVFSENRFIYFQF